MTPTAIRGWAAAAAYTGCSATWLRKLVSSGRLHCMPGADGSYVFEASDLAAISANRSSASASTPPTPEAAVPTEQSTAVNTVSLAAAADEPGPTPNPPPAASPASVSMEVFLAQIGQLRCEIEAAADPASDLHRAVAALVQTVAAFERRITSEVTRRQLAEALLDGRLAAIEGAMKHLPGAPLVTKHRCRACRVGTLAVPASCTHCGFGAGVRSG